MTGMKLKLESQCELPDTLEIRTPAMPDTLNVKLAWVKGLELGVQYIVDAAPADVDIAS